MPLQQIIKNKIFFVSLGCPRNLVDSEVMLGILLKAGYELVEEEKKADYLVVNTCAFLEASRKESKEAILTLLNNRKKGAKLIVAGCMVSKHRKEIEEAFPEVHYLLGSGDVEGILEAVRSDEQGEVIGPAKSYLEQGEVPRFLSTPKHYAYLKIAEGCRKGCAYCIIPKIKGPLQSKSQERITQEFQALLSQGVKEIILIAQDLGDYGKDLGLRQGALVPLLKQLLLINGNYWLRLLYLYPDEISDELIALIKEDKRLCPYLDMPIQHINDEILKNMRRQTNREQICAVLKKLRQEIPDIHIRTSLIVGFPGESEEQFEELVAFVKTYQLHHIGIFKYSQEAETPAGVMVDQIPEAIKEARQQRLYAVQKEVVAKLNKKMVGKTLEVFVEGYHPESNLLMRGRHFGQCPDIDPWVIINDGRKVDSFGKRYKVEITGFTDYDLLGRVIAPIESERKKSKLFITN